MKGFQHISMDGIEKIFKGRKPVPAGKYNYYAVLVPLVEKDEEIHVLFEVRSDSLKRQPGEVCFPGGKLESFETPQACAVRETAEELNIGPDQIQVISELDYIYTYSNFTLYSFLGKLPYESVQNAKVNPDEVKEIFLVPLRFFLKTEPYVYHFNVIPDVREDFPYERIGLPEGYDWRKGKSDVNIYDYEGHAIWGLTGAIIKNVAGVIADAGVIHE